MDHYKKEKFDTLWLPRFRAWLGDKLWWDNQKACYTLHLEKEDLPVIMDFYPIGDRLLIRTENRWISRASQWLQTNVLPEEFKINDEELAALMNNPIAIVESESLSQQDIGDKLSLAINGISQEKVSLHPGWYTGQACPYCDAETEYIDSAFIYGNSFGMIYICKPCKAYVGVHEGTDKALGRLADGELRKAKKAAHIWFDKISRTTLINKIWKEHFPNISNRRKAYIWLAKQMNIPEEICHIGMFDTEDCKRVIEICSRYIQ